MLHRGEIIEQAVRRSGYSITVIAQKVNISRRTVYNLFDNPNVSLEMIEKVGKAIHYDFSKEIPQLRYKGNLEEPQETYERVENTVSYWKDKYYKLLEEYNELLKNRG